MDVPSTITTTTPILTSVVGHFQGHPGNVRQRYPGRSYLQSIRLQAIYGAQERFEQGDVRSQPLQAERIHLTHQIPNDHRCHSSVAPVSRNMAYSSRPLRGLLARPYTQEVPQAFSLSSRTLECVLQSYAIQPFHCSQCLYQIDSTGHNQPGSLASQLHDVSGWLTDLHSRQPLVQTAHNFNTDSDSRHGLPRQSPEIPAHSSTLRFVGLQLGHNTHDCRSVLAECHKVFSESVAHSSLCHTNSLSVEKSSGITELRVGSVAQYQDRASSSCPRGLRRFWRGHTGIC